jgi:hypothetical protein
VPTCIASAGDGAPGTEALTEAHLTANIARRMRPPAARVEQRRPGMLLRGIGLSLGLTVLLLLALWAILRAYRWVLGRLTTATGDLAAGLLGTGVGRYLIEGGLVKAIAWGARCGRGLRLVDGGAQAVPVQPAVG